MPKLPVDLPDDLYEWLREASYRWRIPMAEIVRQALREYQERRPLTSEQERKDDAR